MLASGAQVKKKPSPTAWTSTWAGGESPGDVAQRKAIIVAMAKPRECGRLRGFWQFRPMRVWLRVPNALTGRLTDNKSYKSTGARRAA